MKTIFQPEKATMVHLNSWGQITVPFADRCAEYRDAGYPIKSSWMKTIRVESGIVGGMPVTNQLCSLPKINLYESFILN